jgi:hypothetical protein
MCLRMFAYFCVVLVPLCGAIMSLQRQASFCGSAPRPCAATATARKKEWRKNEWRKNEWEWATLPLIWLCSYDRRYALLVDLESRTMWFLVASPHTPIVVLSLRNETATAHMFVFVAWVYLRWVCVCVEQQWMMSDTAVETRTHARLATCMHPVVELEYATPCVLVLDATWQEMASGPGSHSK